MEQSDRQDLYRAILDSVPHLLFAKDSEGRFVYANRAFLDFLGVSAEADILGRTDRDFNHSPEQIINFQTFDRDVLLEQREVQIPIEFAASADNERTALTTIKRPCLNYVLGISSRIMHSTGVGV